MDAYIGEIRIFAGSKAPENWLFCEGQELAIEDYSALFSLIGVIYGGDGVKSFSLPDLAVRIPVGTGTAVSDIYHLGKTGGSMQVELNAGHLPVHTHSFQVSTKSATKATLESKPSETVLAAATVANDVFYVKPGAAKFTAQVLHSDSVGTAGSGQPHANLMPTMALRYIIATTGEYPDFPS